MSETVGGGRLVGSGGGKVAEISSSVKRDDRIGKSCEKRSSCLTQLDIARTGRSCFGSCYETTTRRHFSAFRPSV
jgi:hypothetical protein